MTNKDFNFEEQTTQQLQDLQFGKVLRRGIPVTIGLLAVIILVFVGIFQLFYS